MGKLKPAPTKFAPRSARASAGEISESFFTTESQSKQEAI
jgi:hypothetical protein